MSFSLRKRPIDPDPLSATHFRNPLLLLLNSLRSLLFLKDTFHQFLFIKLMEVLAPLIVFHLVLLLKQAYLLLLIDVLFKCLFDLRDKFALLLILILKIISLFSKLLLFMHKVLFGSCLLLIPLLFHFVNP